MTILSLDLETYSDVDLSSCGVYKYCEGDFHILLCAYAFNHENVEVVDIANGEEIPVKVKEALFDNGVIKSAWNAQFERVCLSHSFKTWINPESWHCSMIHAASLSYPLSLKTAAQVLEVTQQKDSAGERLIKYFSVPCKPTKSNGGRTRNLPDHAPEDWQKFKDYCIQDVRTERAIREYLDCFPLRSREWEFYKLDQIINDYGVLIDLELAENAIKFDTALSERMKAEAQEITRLENPNSVTQLKKWLALNGLEIDSLNKKSVGEFMKTADGDILKVLDLRQKMSKSSVKKYQAAKRCACNDGRARGLFQFSGANRTQRWAGRFIQLQNLPQNHIATLDEARYLLKSGNFGMLEELYTNIPDILSQLIRTMLIPKNGFEFIVCDFSAIEARVLAWLAGEEWRIEAFRNGEDIYCASASAMFGVPVVKNGINGELRQKGKIAELACGYGGGTGALISMGALDMGLKEDELPGLINDWRKSNPSIVKFWYDVERTAISTIKTQNNNNVQKISFQYYANILWIVLPSGRKLSYINPDLEPNKFGNDALHFDSLNAANKWVRTESYGGKLTENITQATARDLLAEAMLRMHKKGLNVAAHVHDEIILEVPKNSITVEEICSIMNENPDWAYGLPLASAGYKGDYYFKD